MTGSIKECDICFRYQTKNDFQMIEHLEMHQRQIRQKNLTAMKAKKSTCGYCNRDLKNYRAYLDHLKDCPKINNLRFDELEQFLLNSEDRERKLSLIQNVVERLTSAETQKTSTNTRSSNFVPKLRIRHS
jgi:hypothetical protein